MSQLGQVGNLVPGYVGHSTPSPRGAVVLPV